MKQTTTPIKTPSPENGQSEETAKVGSSTNAVAEFFAATWTMSWQLAIVILVPLVGGFELDRKLHTGPALTVVGFVIAMAGVAAVVWRQYQVVIALQNNSQKEQHP